MFTTFRNWYGKIGAFVIGTENVKAFPNPSIDPCYCYSAPEECRISTPGVDSRIRILEVRNTTGNDVHKWSTGHPSFPKCG